MIAPVEVLLMDTNVLLFAPPERIFASLSYGELGVQLFKDYIRAYSTVDPWLVTGYVGSGEADRELFLSITQGAEGDSSGQPRTTHISDRRVGSSGLGICSEWGCRGG